MHMETNKTTNQLPIHNPNITMRNNYTTIKTLKTTATQCQTKNNKTVTNTHETHTHNQTNNNNNL